ncbi:MAG TPA: LacI family DNA-binding transcriptional regulator [Pelobium sp.]
MKKKRITIYDIAEALGISGSYVSKALSNDPVVSEKVKSRVKKKAAELNYKHNSFAANLRRGKSKIIGIIVPKISEIFFANVIAGIEEICYQHKHHIIICQSEESFTKEQEAVETLIRQNVDCVMISLSQETISNAHLKEIINHQTHLIQFDRFDDSVESSIVKNDNEEASYQAVRHLVKQGFKNIAYIGGPEHLAVYNERKNGFIKAIHETGKSLNEDFTKHVSISRDEAKAIALKLLAQKNRPDAFFTASDPAALGVMQAAKELNIKVPQELGVIGFQNEEFTNYISPSLSSVEQRSRDIGKTAANLYFNNIMKTKEKKFYKTEVISCELVVRESSQKRIDA